MNKGLLLLVLVVTATLCALLSMTAAMKALVCNLVRTACGHEIGGSFVKPKDLQGTQQLIQGAE